MYQAHFSVLGEKNKLIKAEPPKKNLTSVYSTFKLSQCRITLSCVNAEWLSQSGIISPYAE